MTLHQATAMASAIAMAFSLTACGGGSGGGGSAIAMTPPPPPAQAPAPAPAPAIGVPDVATTGAVGTAAQASPAGPTLASHTQTIFPLLQTVVSISSTGVVADAGTMSAGTTLAFNSGRGELTMTLGNPAVGVTSPNSLTEADWGPSLRAQNTEWWGERRIKALSAGLRNPAATNLSWTALGYWDVFVMDGADEKPRTVSDFVLGFETPVSAIPRSGSANYTGVVQGQLLNGHGPNKLYVPNISGDAKLTADFARGTISGSLENMVVGAAPWNSVSVQATFGSAANAFTGTTGVTSAPTGGLGASATGSIAGKFFGPVAQEIGAVWTLSDATSVATGTIGAKTGP